jgi:hypothetical protein
MQQRSDPRPWPPKLWNSYESPNRRLAGAGDRRDWSVAEGVVGSGAGGATPFQACGRPVPTTLAHAGREAGVRRSLPSIVKAGVPSGGAALLVSAYLERLAHWYERLDRDERLVTIETRSRIDIGGVCPVAPDGQV